ncbi:hypothetical protein SESBI_45021 [Sesbania bispinosa]|nr:hypothetical protein SESBI_45021 [Sesbania bispinosa]
MSRLAPHCGASVPAPAPFASSITPSSTMGVGCVREGDGQFAEAVFLWGSVVQIQRFQFVASSVGVPADKEAPEFGSCEKRSLHRGRFAEALFRFQFAALFRFQFIRVRRLVPFHFAEGRFVEANLKKSGQRFAKQQSIHIDRLAKESGIEGRYLGVARLLEWLTSVFHPYLQTE